MKDVYQDAMDAVKAPDALVEKTLQSMLEEQKKLAVTTAPKAGSDVRHIPKASARKNRWFAHVALPAAACLCLILLVTVPRLISREADVFTTPVDARRGPIQDVPTHDANAANTIIATPEAITATPEAITPSPYAITESPAASTESPDAIVATPVAHGSGNVEALAIDSLATRSGPATEYRETGTYPLNGEHVRIVALTYDENDVCWVQCEVSYAGKLRRVYTGLARFDTATLDLGSVPEEKAVEGQAKAIATSRAMYGPGDGYGTYADLTVDKGQTVTVVSIEKAYAQVEWTSAKQRYRAWVPVQAIEQIH